VSIINEIIRNNNILYFVHILIVRCTLRSKRNGLQSSSILQLTDLEKYKLEKLAITAGNTHKLSRYVLLLTDMKNIPYKVQSLVQSQRP
jgi:hypothetical protein